jgi:tryptophan synthase beta subunit
LAFADLQGYEYQNKEYQPTNDTTRFMYFKDKESFEKSFGKIKDDINFSQQIVVAVVKYEKKPSLITTQHITYEQKEIIWLYEDNYSNTSNIKKTSPFVGMTLIEKKNFDKVVFVENGKTVYIISTPEAEAKAQKKLQESLNRKETEK